MLYQEPKNMRGFVLGVGKSWNFGAYYRRARFGSTGRWLYWLWVLDTDMVQEMHWNINRWNEKEAYAWKSSCLSSCNAVSVASAIFASVGLSALQLPEIENVYWLTRALLVSSMAVGVLSVIVATAVHKEVTACNSALEIRLWLCRGVTRHRYKPPYDCMPLESSASTIKLVEAPATLLYLATFMYLIGMGFYYLFQFAEVSSAPPSDNRRIFIFFVSIMGSTLSYLLVLFMIRRADLGHRDERLKLGHLFQVGEESSELKTLRNYLKWFQEYRSTEGNDEALHEAYEAACAIINHEEASYVLRKKVLCADKIFPMAKKVMVENIKVNGQNE